MLISFKSLILLMQFLYLCGIGSSAKYDHWPFRKFKINEHSLIKNSSTLCVFVDCRCQDRVNKKLSINCTKEINFPSRLDTENFMDFDQQTDNFLLANNKLKQIPDKTFKNLRLGRLEVTGNNIEVIGTNLFSGVKQLNRLLIKNETNLKLIEKDAFVPIKYLLLELDLSNNDIDDFKMNTFSNEISKLHNLQGLELNNNRLTKVKSEWFANLENLDVLNLASNFLRSIDSNGFEGLSSLKRISLANNLFEGDFNQTSLDHLKNTLTRIDLSHNEIKTLPTFSYLEKLRYFDLSHNSINSIEASTFTLLFNLYSLDLTSNNISLIEKNAFSTLSNLFYLHIGDNQLSAVPDVTGLISLVTLDVQNQNGNLVELKDFQFQRKGLPYLPLEVNLEDNQIETFEKKVFCSMAYNDSQLDSLTMSFHTFSSIIDLNHCVLSQLKPENSEFRSEWTQLNIVDFDRYNISEQFKEKNYCNCDLKLFFENFKLNLTGIDGCPLITDAWKNDTTSSSVCEDNIFIDTCHNQVNYKCNYTPTTRSTTTKTTKRPYIYYASGSAATAVQMQTLALSLLVFVMFA